MSYGHAVSVNSPVGLEPTTSDELDLKSERVQEALAAATWRARTRLKSERVQEELKALPGWNLLSDGRTLDRVREFSDSQVAMSYAQFAEALARQAKVTFAAHVAEGVVLVTIKGKKSHGRYGLPTRIMLDVARQLG